MNEIIIVGQDEGAPLLHLKAVLTTGDSLAAVYLGGLEVLRTQPGLINHLGGRQRGEDWGERERDTGEKNIAKLVMVPSDDMHILNSHTVTTATVSHRTQSDICDMQCLKTVAVVSLLVDIQFNQPALQNN